MTSEPKPLDCVISVLFICSSSAYLIPFLWVFVMCIKCEIQVLLRPMQTDTTSHNIVAWFFGQQCCVRLHGPKSLPGFKLYATSANIVVVPCKQMQHVGPNNVVCWPAMLYPFAWGFKILYKWLLGSESFKTYCKIQL